MSRDLAALSTQRQTGWYRPSPANFRARAQILCRSSAIATQHMRTRQQRLFGRHLDDPNGARVQQPLKAVNQATAPHEVAGYVSVVAPTMPVDRLQSVFGTEGNVATGAAGTPANRMPSREACHSVVQDWLREPVARAALVALPDVDRDVNWWGRQPSAATFALIRPRDGWIETPVMGMSASASMSEHTKKSVGTISKIRSSDLRFLV